MEMVIDIINEDTYEKLGRCELCNGIAGLKIHVKGNANNTSFDLNICPDCYLKIKSKEK